MARAILALQFQERGPDGRPSVDARLGAMWQAEQDMKLRDLRTIALAFAGVNKKGGD